MKAGHRWSGLKSGVRIEIANVYDAHRAVLLEEFRKNHRGPQPNGRPGCTRAFSGRATFGSANGLAW